VLTEPAAERRGCHADRREIADMVRSARESRGLTQHELAIRMGSTQSTVARWETGSHQLTLATLDRIANALGVAMQVRFGPSGGHL
jgi:transcriptional regulator with XRE-family HTH domain